MRDKPRMTTEPMPVASALSNPSALSIERLAGWLEDPANGWSIGRFGAIGEFSREADEPAALQRTPQSAEVITARGALRIAPTQALRGVAWASLGADGHTWSHTMALCVALPVGAPGAALDGAAADAVVQPRGRDAEAIRPQDRDAALFDLGVGAGAVRMLVRTRDAALSALLTAGAGRPLQAIAGIAEATLRAQPQRVLLSPAGRLEVFQPIPPPDGRSPDGPHTHLLPRLIASGLLHSATTPLPAGWQAALTLHPPPPWRTAADGQRWLDTARDAAFAPLLAEFGLDEDRQVQAELEAALEAGLAPETFAWPESRRGRLHARIVLRRLAARQHPRAAAWRACHDHGPADAAACS